MEAKAKACEQFCRREVRGDDRCGDKEAQQPNRYPGELNNCVDQRWPCARPAHQPFQNSADDECEGTCDQEDDKGRNKIRQQGNHAFHQAVQLVTDDLKRFDSQFHGESIS